MPPALISTIHNTLLSQSAIIQWTLLNLLLMASSQRDKCYQAL